GVQKLPIAIEVQWKNLSNMVLRQAKIGCNELQSGGVKFFLPGAAGSHHFLKPTYSTRLWPPWFAPEDYAGGTFADVATYVGAHVGHGAPPLAHVSPQKATVFETHTIFCRRIPIKSNNVIPLSTMTFTVSHASYA
ncbi:unnamed protein product, partial [Sphenostylis stenocarpa]